MAWIVLIVSGMLEAVWAAALGASDGFKRKAPTLLFIVSLIASMAGLAYAMNDIATGTAYSVWVGIGALLTAIWGIWRRYERATWARIALLATLVISVVGLKVVS